MGKEKKKKCIVEETEDFGICVLYCKDCNYTFEIDWETIFAIQECTHGYVGFHLDDVMIECPKCHKFISNSTNDDHHLTDTKKPKRNITIEDNELPF
ncbi:hypothetical protein [Bacillus sp. FJAT-45350]|uniref:hypothetical protein n=1 Tax=Bacillus sp. FJAT-45350 TaxID=2011014 RepID=UPI000BB8D9F6|nr:hypothetical protein [Bacillus sp. FJAT-45350]